MSNARGPASTGVGSDSERTRAAVRRASARRGHALVDEPARLLERRGRAALLVLVRPARRARAEDARARARATSTPRPGARGPRSSSARRCARRRPSRRGARPRRRRRRRRRRGTAVLAVRRRLRDDLVDDVLHPILGLLPRHRELADGRRGCGGDEAIAQREEDEREAHLSRVDNRVEIRVRSRTPRIWSQLARAWANGTFGARFLQKSRLWRGRRLWRYNPDMYEFEENKTPHVNVPEADATSKKRRPEKKRTGESSVITKRRQLGGRAWAEARAGDELAFDFSNEPADERRGGAVGALHPLEASQPRDDPAGRARARPRPARPRPPPPPPRARSRRRRRRSRGCSRPRRSRRRRARAHHVAPRAARPRSLAARSRPRGHEAEALSLPHAQASRCSTSTTRSPTSARRARSTTRTSAGGRACSRSSRACTRTTTSRSGRRRAGGGSRWVCASSAEKAARRARAPSVSVSLPARRVSSER